VEDQEISFRFPVGAEIFLFSTLSGPEVGPTPTPFAPCTGTFSAGIKRLERESEQLIKFLSRG